MTMKKMLGMIFTIFLIIALCSVAFAENYLYMGSTGSIEQDNYAAYYLDADTCHVTKDSYWGATVLLREKGDVKSYLEMEYRLSNTPEICFEDFHIISMEKYNKQDVLLEKSDTPNAAWVHALPNSMAEKISHKILQINAM